jgi:putative toxin-antitoxin system antitoxin component (TIGR02293 family)
MSESTGAARAHQGVKTTHVAARHHTQRFRSVLTRALEVIGDEHETMRWMGTPVQALNYATPISLLDGPDGEEIVLSVLTRLEHGVF